MIITDVSEFMKVTYKVLLSIITYVGLAYILRFNFDFALLVINIVAVTHVIILLRTKLSLLLILHPFLVQLIAFQFDSPFMLAGDGEAYQNVVRQYLNSETLDFYWLSIASTEGLLSFLRYTNLGIVPIIALPEFIFGSIEDTDYYKWQMLVHLLLVLTTVIITTEWRELEYRYMSIIVVFSLLSPSFIELTSTPTRHVVTFYSVLLLFITHVSIISRYTLERLFWYILAIILVVISKVALLIPYGIYVVIEMLYYRSIVKDKRNLILIIALVTASLFVFPIFVEIIERYFTITALTGAATYSSLTQIPIIGVLIKYIYALLSPFPWGDVDFITSHYYSGNITVYVMHILSAITGSYLICTTLLEFRTLSKIEVSKPTLYGLIMSTSIIGGATGFHTYILIYFPFMAVILLNRKNVNWLLLLFIICAIAVLEVSLILLK